MASCYVMGKEVVMDYRKIDAGLAATLDEIEDPEERALAVFIHIKHPPINSEAALLEKLGVSGITRGRQIFTATLSARDVAELSAQPWVRYLKLSRKLHLLKEK